jgi:hypothetical protein
MSRKPRNPNTTTNLNNGADLDDEKEPADNQPQTEFSGADAVSVAAAPHPVDPAPARAADKVSDPLVLRDPLTKPEVDAANQNGTPVIVDDGAGHQPTSAEGEDEGFSNGATLKGVADEGGKGDVNQPTATGRIVPPSRPLPTDPEVERAKRGTSVRPPGQKPNVEAAVPGVNIPRNAYDTEDATDEDGDPVEPAVAPRPPSTQVNMARPHLVNGFPAHDVPEADRKRRIVTYPPPTEDVPEHLRADYKRKPEMGLDGPGRSLRELNEEAWAVDEKHRAKIDEAQRRAMAVAEPLLRDVPRTRGAMRRMQKDVVALPPDLAKGKLAQQSIRKR